MSSTFKNTITKKMMQGGSKQKFIIQTFLMISNCDPSIAGWNTLGDTAVIRDVDKFSNEILPKYFRHSKYKSFARQLNFYKFVTHSVVVATGGDCSGGGTPREPEKRFANPNFHRDRPDLLYKIRRMDSPSQKMKKKKKETRTTEEGGGSHYRVIDSESDIGIHNEGGNEDDVRYETIDTHHHGHGQQTQGHHIAAEMYNPHDDGRIIGAKMDNTMMDPVEEEVREQVTEMLSILDGSDSGEDRDDETVMASSGGVTPERECPSSSRSSSSPLSTLSTVATAFLHAERNSIMSINTRPKRNIINDNDSSD